MKPRKGQINNSRSSTPEPLRSLIKFVKEIRKAEKITKDYKVTGGEIIFGSLIYKGQKTRHRLANEVDNFVNAVSENLIDE